MLASSKIWSRRVWIRFIYQPKMGERLRAQTPDGAVVRRHGADADAALETEVVRWVEPESAHDLAALAVPGRAVDGRRPIEDRFYERQRVVCLEGAVREELD